MLRFALAGLTVVFQANDPAPKNDAAGDGEGTARAPGGLLCERMSRPWRTRIPTPAPRFGWIVNDNRTGAMQNAYRIQVATTEALLDRNAPDVWDSERVASTESVGVRYGGPPLNTDATYWWRVRTWNDRNGVSPFSTPQRFRTAEAWNEGAPRYPLVEQRQPPHRFARISPDTVVADFGRAAFGTVELTIDAPDARTIVVHLGEKSAGDGRPDRDPPGSVRYRRIPLDVTPGVRLYRLTIPPDARNTRPPAIRMPASVGEVMPFRYCQLANVPR